MGSKAMQEQRSGAPRGENEYHVIQHFFFIS